MPEMRRAQGSDLAGLVRNEQDAGRLRRRPNRGPKRVPTSLLRDVLQRADRRTGHGANRIEHAAVVLFQERLRRRAATRVAQFRGIRHHQQPV